MSDPAKTIDQNILPVQALFNLDNSFNTFIGQGQPFYATTNPIQSGLTITNSTIDSTTIGATTPSTGVFTNILTTTGQITTTPTASLDIANKAYVDATSQGLSFKQPVLVTTTGNITLSGTQTIDGIAVSIGDRVLVKNQTATADNGIYIVASGAWSRSPDANTWDELLAAYLFVLKGTVWAGSSWVDTNVPGGTLGVTPVTFVQFSNNATYTAGTGLTLTGFQFSITPVGTAGTYGSASNVPVLTTNASGQISSVTNTPIAIGASQVTSGTFASSLLSGSYTGITGVGTLTAGTWNGSTIGVAYGGTGANTFTTGYLKASGTAAFTTVSSIPSSDITGLGTMSTQNANNVNITGGTIALTTPLAVSSGGSGATTLTGYLIGNGTSAFTASTTIPTTALSGTISNAQLANSSITINGNSVSLGGSTTVTALTPNTLTIGTGLSGGSFNGSAAVTIANTGVLSFSAGTTGFTPSTTTTGAVTLGGLLALSNGGTNANLTAVAGGVAYSGASALAISSAGTTGQFLQSNGAGAPTWATPVSYATVTDDTTTAGTRYPLFANQTSGSLSTEYTSSTKLQYNPSTGVFTSTSFSGAGTGLTGTAASLSIGGNATTATSATTATNLAGGANGSVPYQTSSGATTMLAAGTNGNVLTLSGGVPTWATPIASLTITDDTTTNATRYLTFTSATSGTVTSENVSSTKLQYNPSTGTLKSVGQFSSDSTFGFKNRIINGAMGIWQTGTTLSTNNSQGYYLDQMWGFSGLSTASTFTQGTSSGLAGFPYFARAQRTAGNTGTTGTFTGQIIESNNLQDLQSQTVTLSFWARAGSNYSSASNGLGVTLRTGTVADQGLNQLIVGWTGVADQNTGVTLTTSWQYFNKTFTVPSNAQEITYFFNSVGVGTAGANDYYDVTGVQLEKGSTATSFDYRPYTTELVLCQRYQVVMICPPARGVWGNITSINRGAFSLPVQMRTSPTVSLNGTMSVYDGTNTGTVTSFTATYTTPTSVEFDANSATGTFGIYRPFIAYNNGNLWSLKMNAQL